MRGAAKLGGSTDILVAHPSSELYGSDRVLIESIQAMLDRGWRVVVALPTDGPLVTDLQTRGATVVLCRVPVLRKSALRPAGLRTLLGDAVTGLLPAIRLIREHGRGAVYVNTITIPSWLILARILGKPVVCHIHEAERSAPAPVRAVMAAPLVAATSIIANSRFSVEVLGDSLPRVAKRCQVVYNGIPGPPDVEVARETLQGPVRLLFIGRLSPRKGPQVALETARELLARGVDVRLEVLGSVFTGYEWFESELRESAGTGLLAGKVDFLGFEPDVWPRMAAADIILVPSTVDEPFGNTAVEAVLAARPLIVSTTSGLKEAAAGYACAQAMDPADPPAWAGAIEKVITDWSAFRAAALADSETARQRHSPATYQQQIADIVLAARQ